MEKTIQNHHDNDDDNDDGYPCRAYGADSPVVAPIQAIRVGKDHKSGTRFGFCVIMHRSYAFESHSLSLLLSWIAFFLLLLECSPRNTNQSGYWLLIAMVLLSFVMVVPLLKGLLHLIGAYLNLVIFACIFFFRKPEAMATLAAFCVVIAHSYFGASIYIHYNNDDASSTYGNNCDVLLLLGIRSRNKTDFCHDSSNGILSILCGCAWMVIGGCLFRFVELRRGELAKENLRQQQQQQQQYRRREQELARQETAA